MDVTPKIRKMGGGMILLYDIFTLLYSFIKIFQRLISTYTAHEHSLETNQNGVSTKIRKRPIIIICDTAFNVTHVAINVIKIFYTVLLSSSNWRGDGQIRCQECETMDSIC